MFDMKRLWKKTILIFAEMRSRGALNKIPLPPAAAWGERPGLGLAPSRDACSCRFSSSGTRQWQLPQPPLPIREQRTEKGTNDSSKVGQAYSSNYVRKAHRRGRTTRRCGRVYRRPKHVPVLLQEHRPERSLFTVQLKIRVSLREEKCRTGFGSNSFPCLILMGMSVSKRKRKGLSTGSACDLQTNSFLRTRL